MYTNELLNKLKKISEDIFTPISDTEKKTREVLRLAYLKQKAEEDRKNREEYERNIKLGKDATKEFISNLNFTYEDIIKLPIYNKIISLLNVKDTTGEVQKQRRTTQFTYAFDKKYFNGQTGKGYINYIVYSHGVLRYSSGGSGGLGMGVLSRNRSATNLKEYSQLLEKLYTTMVKKINKTSNTKIQEDIFTPISQDDMQKRKEEKAERLRKEREDRIKQWEKEVPQIKTIIEALPALVKEVNELCLKYRDDQAVWLGNYSKLDYYDNPKEISFNIKVYNYGLPAKYEKRIEELDYQPVYDYLGQQLDAFVEWLKEDYKFINKWYQAGRSGGWLVLDIDNVEGLDSDADYDTDYYLEKLDLGSATEDLEEFDAKGIIYAYEYLLDLRDKLKKRIQDLIEIYNKVEAAKKAINQDLSSPKFWKEYFDNGY